MLEMWGAVRIHGTYGPIIIIRAIWHVIIRNMSNSLATM